MQITDSFKSWTNGWSDWLSYKSRVFLSDNYQHSCPKFANILSGISILEIMDLVPFISIARNKLHANNVQLFTSPAYDYLWPPTSYLNLLSRLVYFLAAFKEMKTLNCPTNTPFTLICLMKNAFLNIQEMHFMPNNNLKGNISHCPHKIRIMSRKVAFP